MAYISYIELWESDFDNIVSERDKLQDLTVNQLKLEAHYDKKDGKVTTHCEASNPENVLNKACLDENFQKTDEVTYHL